ncbi:MAG TPA: hypothetical protein VHC95_05400 [Opitutales bacterium]|nr:hypothetical protein [Opitutales bacterium]
MSTSTVSLKNQESLLALGLSVAVVALLVVYFAFINPAMFREALTGRGDAPPWTTGPARSMRYLGDYSAATDQKIPLPGTEGKTFRLTGQVWLNGRSTTARFPDEAADGVAFLARETNSLHRYEFNPDWVRDKRRMLQGAPESKIVRDVSFPRSPLHTWIPFSLLVSEQGITYLFDKNMAKLDGPLATDGKNNILLVAGSRLRDVRLEILGDAKSP